MGSRGDWQTFLEEFRNFGGRAENVIQRDGPLGLGLFPIDPSQPVELMVPKPLLVPAGNVELHNGDAVIHDDSAFPHGYADWFRRYQATYSWGAEGEASVTRFETGLQQLPETLRQTLQSLNLYQPQQRLPKTDWRENMLRRFLNSRCLGRQGQLLVMPIVELVNHAPSAGNWETRPDGGVGISGRRQGEILVKYSNADPLRRLMGYGFNALETMAFSLRVQLQHRRQPVLVQGGGGRHWIQPAGIEQRDELLAVQQPLLGHREQPKLPKSLFLHACKSLTNVEPAELFDQIHRANTLALVDVLHQLEHVAGETADQLRNGCLDQLEVLSNHVGHRRDMTDADGAMSEPRHPLPTPPPGMGQSADQTT